MDRIGSPLFVEIICGPALTVSSLMLFKKGAQPFSIERWRK